MNLRERELRDNSSQYSITADVIMQIVWESHAGFIGVKLSLIVTSSALFAVQIFTHT